VTRCRNFLTVDNKNVAASQTGVPSPRELRYDLVLLCRVDQLVDALLVLSLGGFGDNIFRDILVVLSFSIVGGIVSSSSSSDHLRRYHFLLPKHYPR